MKKRGKKLCEFKGCRQNARFAIFRLNEDLTKTWMDLCDLHDKLVAQKSRRLRAAYPNVRWVEYSK